ncbi:MAG: class I SAM-dependent methyltransferase [Thermoplasmatales archaeon]|nr:MAG: class I SAM-dependent methyltransferase [Thermoplasmatales archaeon]
MNKMVKSANDSCLNLQTKKPDVIVRLLIFLTNRMSNFFWGIADILSNKFDKFAEIYEKSIGSEYITEYKTFGLSQDKKVLHIGCGAYPLTEMTLAKIFSTEVTGIDKNLKAVKLAEEFIHKYKLDDKINIEHGNGVDYSANKFDVIIISSCAYPKIKILHHIFKSAKKQSIIVVRELDIASNDILECIDSHEDIILEKRMHHPAPLLVLTGWDAFFLIKR